MRKLKPEQFSGLLFVLLLHGAALYGLWHYRLIPAPAEAATLMVQLIDPAVPDKPEPHKPEVRPIAPPRFEHTHLVVDTPVVHPDEMRVPPPAVVEYVSPTPAAPTLPLPPVVLAGELSVSCPERSPPDYPSLSMRLNEQGRIVLRVELDADGKITGVSIKTSSGFLRLDDAAMNAVKTWHCKPALRDGIPTPAIALQPFDFILEGR
jgi:protein TonB